MHAYIHTLIHTHQAWKDVAWYDAEECMGPIARLTLNKNNRLNLANVGMVGALAELMVSFGLYVCAWVLCECAWVYCVGVFVSSYYIHEPKKQNLSIHTSLRKSIFARMRTYIHT
jgi:hypothetical protein